MSAATTFLFVPILAKSFGNEANATGVAVFLGVTGSMIPTTFASQVRARLGSGARFVSEDEAATILAGKVDEITAELKVEKLDGLAHDLEIAKRLASDARKIVSGKPADDDLPFLADYSQRVATMLEGHVAKPLPVKVVRLDNVRNADPAVSPLVTHDKVRAAVARLVELRDKIDACMSALGQAAAAIEAAKGKAEKLRSGTLEGFAERLAAAERTPDHRRELGQIADELAGLASRLAALAGTDDATPKPEVA